MRTKRIDWDRWVPAGVDGRGTFRGVAWLLGAAMGLTLSVPFRYIALRGELYDWTGTGERVLIPERVMAPFYEVLGGALWGFGILALCLAALAVRQYLFHWQGGSRSIYLMRRLPDRWELHRRCLTLPALGAAGGVLAAGALVLLYYGLYRLATPAECLQPGQWRLLWQAWTM